MQKVITAIASSSVLNQAGKPFVEQTYPEVQKLLDEGYRISVVIPQISQSGAVVFITYVLDNELGQLAKPQVAMVTT